MAYPYYQNYQPGFYSQPMQDNLAQLRNSYAPPQPPQNPILWVGSEMEADQYPVAPNNAVVLWDSNAPKVYLKQSDASGRISKKTYRLTEENAPMPVSAPNTGDFVTRKEFEAAIAELRKEPEHEPTV